jgi:cation transporter-like permease
MGLLSWGLIEYGLHRFIFHYHARSRLGVKLLYQVHLSHHEDPEAINRLFASLLLSTPIASTYWLLAWAVTGSWAAASYCLSAWQVVTSIMSGSTFNAIIERVDSGF